MVTQRERDRQRGNKASGRTVVINPGTSRRQVIKNYPSSGRFVREASKKSRKSGGGDGKPSPAPSSEKGPSSTANFSSNITKGPATVTSSGADVERGGVHFNQKLAETKARAVLLTRAQEQRNTSGRQRVKGKATITRNKITVEETRTPSGGPSRIDAAPKVRSIDDAVKAIRISADKAEQQSKKESSNSQLERTFQGTKAIALSFGGRFAENTKQTADLALDFGRLPENRKVLTRQNVEQTFKTLSRPDLIALNFGRALKERPAQTIGTVAADVLFFKVGSRELTKRLPVKQSTLEKRLIGIDKRVSTVSTKKGVVPAESTKVLVFERPTKTLPKKPRQRIALNTQVNERVFLEDKLFFEGTQKSKGVLTFDKKRNPIVRITKDNPQPRKLTIDLEGSVNREILQVPKTKATTFLTGTKRKRPAALKSEILEKNLGAKGDVLEQSQIIATPSTFPKAARKPKGPSVKKPTSKQSGPGSLRLTGDATKLGGQKAFLEVEKAGKKIRQDFKLEGIPKVRQSSGFTESGKGVGALYTPRAALPKELLEQFDFKGPAKVVTVNKAPKGFKISEAPLIVSQAQGRSISFFSPLAESPAPLELESIARRRLSQVVRVTPINTQIEDARPKTGIKPLVELKPFASQKTAPGTRSRGRSRPITKSRPITDITPITKQRPVTKQKPLISQKPITRQKGRARTPAEQRSLLKKFGVPVPQTRRKRGQARPGQAFEVQVRRGGKFFTIAKGLPENLANLVGTKRLRKTLAATYRLVPSGTTKIRDVNFSVPRGIFREFKIFKGKKIPTPDVFVQKTTQEGGAKKGRLADVGEVAEIKTFRKSNPLSFL